MSNEPGTRIYLVRHGETAWSISGQHTGKTDIALTAHGEEQALALAPVLGTIHFDTVLTSPALRARRTCELAGFAAKAVVEPDLAEWDYGDYEGRRSSDIRKDRPGWIIFQDGSPGGEGVADVTARADRVVASLRALSGTVLVFSHGHFGSSLAARWNRMAVAEARHLQLDPASISVLGFNRSDPDLAVIAHWNFTPAMLQTGGGWPVTQGSSAARSDEKRLAARAAADEIRPGMIVGLGSGSTVAELIPILAARVRDGLDIVAVSTSEATSAAARAAGIGIVGFEDRSRIDLAIDGVDEIDATLRAIKGAGGALLREKIVATASQRMIAIADGSKFSAAIGGRPVPVEILPFARAFVLASLAALGAVPTLRLTAGQPARSDQGNLLADCTFPALADPASTAAQLSAIPGLLGHGLFLSEIDALYMARGGKVTRYERP